MMATTVRSLKPGDRVRPMARSGVWRVMKVKAGRAECRPVSGVWGHGPQWIAVDDLVRAEK